MYAFTTMCFNVTIAGITDGVRDGVTDTASCIAVHPLDAAEKAGIVGPAAIDYAQAYAFGEELYENADQTERAIMAAYAAGLSPVDAADYITCNTSPEKAVEFLDDVPLMFITHHARNWCKELRNMFF